MRGRNMRGWIRNLGFAAVMSGVWMGLSAFGPPPKEIRLALQEGGTAAWEIAAMRAAGLDARNEITVKIRDTADSKAGQVALQAGKVDVILSDFVWTSLQRGQGADFTFVPHSLAVGGLMALPGGKVQSVADLKGATLAVAGGPVDKSFLFLQACYAAKTGGNLTEDARTTFGAPPLVNEQLAGGGADASLNFWHFNARAMVAGARQIISVPEMLKELGVSRTPPPARLGVFRGLCRTEPRSDRAFPRRLVPDKGRAPDRRRPVGEDPSRHEGRG